MMLEELRGGGCTLSSNIMIVRNPLMKNGGILVINVDPTNMMTNMKSLLSDGVNRRRLSSEEILIQYIL